MTDGPYTRRYERLSAAELQEALCLSRLDWMLAHSHGIDVVADEHRRKCQALVAEHLIRKLDPDTGRPFRTAERLAELRRRLRALTNAEIQRLSADDS